MSVGVEVKEFGHSGCQLGERCRPKLTTVPKKRYLLLPMIKKSYSEVKHEWLKSWCKYRNQAEHFLCLETSPTNVPAISQSCTDEFGGCFWESRVKLPPSLEAGDRVACETVTCWSCEEAGFALCGLHAYLSCRKHLLKRCCREKH